MQTKLRCSSPLQEFYYQGILHHSLENMLLFNKESLVLQWHISFTVIISVTVSAKWNVRISIKRTVITYSTGSSISSVRFPQIWNKNNILWTKMKSALKQNFTTNKFSFYVPHNGAAHLIEKYNKFLLPNVLLPLRHLCSCGYRTGWWCIFELGWCWWWRSGRGQDGLWVSCTPWLTRRSLFSAGPTTSPWGTFWWWYYGNSASLSFLCNRTWNYILFFCVVVCNTSLWLIQLSWSWPCSWLESQNKCN